MVHLKEFEHLKISLEAINLATNNYSDDNCIGRGGFGNVYKGEIVHSHGKSVVALKRLDRKFGQGDPEFWREIMMLSQYKHENIVSLVGYCDDYSEKILLYQYASNKSLDRYLQNEELTWVRRLKICIGAANGLAYLHTPTGDNLRVLHRDVKSANILLDENWNAKISDFGLSKVAPANSQLTYLITDPVGTSGYIDPEYSESGLLTKESDVYSFGVVLFEVLCGRLCYGNNIDGSRPLIGLVREYHEENKMRELIFNRMKGEINSDCLKVFTEIGYQCLERERTKRPSMKEIVEALERALEYQCPDPDAEEKAKEKMEAEAKGKAKMEAEEREKQGILEVKFIRTTDSIFKRSIINPIAASKYYLVVTQFPYQDIHKTVAKHNNLNTKWNEKFALYVEDLSRGYLKIHVINMVSVEKHDYLGSGKVWFKQLIPKKLNIFYLQITDESDKFICKLWAELVFKPFAYDGIPSKIKDIITIPKAPLGTPKGGGLLVVIIHSAELLCVKEDHRNASVTLLLNGDIKTTLCMMNTKRPVWGQEFTYMLDRTPTQEDILSLEIFDNSQMGELFNQRKEAKSLGFHYIRLGDVVEEKRSIDYGYNEIFNIQVELQWRTSD